MATPNYLELIADGWDPLTASQALAQAAGDPDATCTHDDPDATCTHDDPAADAPAPDDPVVGAGELTELDDLLDEPLP